MKKTIAIVSPSPVPFVNGGIENLTWSLAGYLNGAGDVHVELIKVPSPEYDFESLMTSYERFSLLDLTHFDSIISVKYPAWMVRHPDHRIYMAHCLRGLYDTYPEQQMGWCEYVRQRRTGVQQLRILRWVIDGAGADTVESLQTLTYRLGNCVASGDGTEMPGVKLMNQALYSQLIRRCICARTVLGIPELIASAMLMQQPESCVWMRSAIARKLQVDDLVHLTCAETGQILCSPPVHRCFHT